MKVNFYKPVSFVVYLDVLDKVFTDFRQYRMFPYFNFSKYKTK